jgi:nitroimidazol reductase NimA-like FMN-containing flavoprotein (pyridoxamine 5'-phosphate oxidase superfamily)
MDKAITNPSEMKQLLMTVPYVTLAMSKDNIPYLVTLSHGYNPEKNEVYFHSANEGKKLEIVKENPRVWGQGIIDLGYHQGECNHHYASVMFSGEVSFIEDRDEKWDILAGMTRKLEEDPERLIEARNHTTVMKTIVGKIKIEHMTGKKSKEFL